MPQGPLCRPLNCYHAKTNPLPPAEYDRHGEGQDSQDDGGDGVHVQRQWASPEPSAAEIPKRRLEAERTFPDRDARGHVVDRGVAVWRNVVWLRGFARLIRSHRIPSCAATRRPGPVETMRSMAGVVKMRRPIVACRREAQWARRSLPSSQQPTTSRVATRAVNWREALAERGAPARQSRRALRSVSRRRSRTRPWSPSPMLRRFPGERGRKAECSDRNSRRTRTRSRSGWTRPRRARLARRRAQETEVIVRPPRSTRELRARPR